MNSTTLVNCTRLAPFESFSTSQNIGSDGQPTSQTIRSKRRGSKRAGWACMACRLRKGRCTVSLSGPPCSNCIHDEIDWSDQRVAAISKSILSMLLSHPSIEMFSYLFFYQIEGSNVHQYRNLRTRMGRFVNESCNPNHEQTGALSQTTIAKGGTPGDSSQNLYIDGSISMKQSIKCSCEVLGLLACPFCEIKVRLHFLFARSQGQRLDVHIPSY